MTTCHRQWALTSLLVVALLTSKATGKESRVLDLASVVRQGLSFSPELKQAEAKLREAQAATATRERLLFPTIDFTGSTKFKRDPSRVPSLSVGLGDEDYDAAVALTQPIFRGGALLNGIGSTKVAEEIERQRMNAVRQMTVSDLVNAYYTLAETEQRLAVAEEYRNVLKSYADIVGRYESIGRARRMDRLQATVNLSLSEAERVKIERERLVASDALKRLLGLSEGGAPLSGQLKISLAPAAPLTVEQALASAIKNNPDYLVAELELKKREYDNALELVEDRPTLNLEGRWGYRSQSRPDWFDESSRYYSVGLALNVPLFSGLTSLAKRRSHAERLKQSEKAVDIKRLDLRELIMKANVALKSEFERLTTAEAAAKQGREALQLANYAYRQGVASSQDVLNAQRTRYDSERLLIESQFSYLRSLLELRRLMGVDLEKVYAP